MKLERLKITKRDLDNIPEDERYFFLQLLNLLNDLNTLQKTILFSVPESEVEDTNIVISHGQNTIMVCSLFTLTGKLYEGWKIIHRLFYGTGLSKEFSKEFNDEEKKNLDYLYKYFEKNKLFKEIRDNISSHYGRDNENIDILKMNYDEFSEEEELFIYFNEQFGNWVSTTQLITLKSILNHMNSGSKEMTTQESLNTLFTEIISISKRFQTFIGNCFDIITEKYFQDKRDDVEIPDPDKIGEVFLPFFIRPRD